MDNVKFHYLYRDGSNYKKWASVVFSNGDRLPIEAATRSLGEAFLEDGIFIAHQVRVPEIFLALEDNLTPDDHCFHEFDSVVTTSDIPNDPSSRSILEFMAEVAREAERGWRAFDPQDRLLQRAR
jgi:hypothetical protein